MIHGYHVHVYFDEATRASAEAIRTQLIKNFSGRIRVHGLIDEPIGPHPKPMFEADLPPTEFGAVVPWLMLNHGTHSVLVHPLIGDEMAEHRDHPLWIGPQLPLDLAFLASLEKRR